MKQIPKTIDRIRHGGVRSLLKRALELGIDVKFSSQNDSIAILTYKNKKIVIKKSTVPLQRRMGNMTTDKNLTKICLKEFGINSPKGFVSNSSKEALKMVRKMKLRYPLILKPVNGTLARGVIWDIRTEKELEKSIIQFKKTEKKFHYSHFIVEEMQTGKEYRVLIYNGRVVSCVEKIAASVIGDGVSTIDNLIHQFNKKRKKGFEIKIDKVVIENLKRNKLDVKSVIPKGKILKLRNNLNMSDGGRSVEYTKKMSKFFKKVCEKACSAVGISYGGIDLFTKDISLSGAEYAILEINPNPFYNMHEKPLVEGRGIDFSLKILKFLFPGLK